ncbi:MAG: potassium channel protein [Leptospiraceae bacterium]|nr:potassium channel protein [Leptospiraceae bacterium]MCP5492934.1 potassium channel protein [Leptospiraceae bacterium]
MIKLNLKKIWNKTTKLILFLKSEIFVFLHYFKIFVKPVLFLLLLLCMGTFGYKFLERDWSFFDAVYMTIISITTVGYGEVHPLSEPGRYFTIFLLIGGVVFYGVTINTIARSMIENKFSEYMVSIRMQNKIQNLKNHYIVCGGGRMAVTIGKELEGAKKEFVFIENNKDAPIMFQSTKYPVIEGNALLEETLIEAKIKDATGLAAVLPTDADNLFVVLSAKKLNPSLNIITRISYETTRPKMIQAGANKVISPYSVGGIQIARSFINPEIDDFLEIIMDKASFEFEMKIVKIEKHDKYHAKKLRNADFRKDGFMVIGVRFPDGKQLFAPEADFVLKEGYEVLLLGAGENKK